MLLTNTPLVHDGYHGEACTHLSVTEIELCQDWQDGEWAAQIAAEQAAEQGYERQLEDAGYWAARQQEDEEARRGVVQFEDAYAQALGYLDAGEREWAADTGADLADLLDQQWDKAAELAADRHREDEAYGRF